MDTFRQNQTAGYEVNYQSILYFVLLCEVTLYVPPVALRTLRMLLCWVD